MTGNPFFHLTSYEVLTQTRTYPGETVYEFLDPDFSPFTFVLARPREILRKVSVSLMGLYSPWLSVSNPYVTALFLVGLFFPLANPSAQQMRWTLVLMLALRLGGVSLTSPRPESLLPFVPLVTLLGAASFAHLLTNQVSGLSLGRFHLRQAVLHRLLGGGLFLLVVYPLVFTQSLRSRGGPLEPLPEGEMLRQLTEPGEVIMTDIPELLAWHTDRPCVRLCQHEADFQRLGATVAPVQALYFSPRIWDRDWGEQAAWWSWVLRSRSGYRQFVRLQAAAPGAVLLLRDTKLARWKALEKKEKR